MSDELDYRPLSPTDFEACVEYREHLTKILQALKMVCDKDETCRRRLCAYAKRRGLPVEFLDEHGIFFLSKAKAESFEKKHQVSQPDWACVPKPELRDKYNLWRAQSRKVFRYIGASLKGGVNMLADRIVFPLYSYITKDDKPLACGICGYDMGDSPLAKYIYANTPYFYRGAYLYGEDKLLTIPKNKTVFMAEGLVDKLWLEYEIKRLGFDFDTYAVCGVNATEEKMAKLWLLSENAYHIVYFPDRDKPGKDFTDDLLKRLGNIKVTVAYVRQGCKDPADHFKNEDEKYDADKFKALLGNTLESYKYLPKEALL